MVTLESQSQINSDLCNKPTKHFCNSWLVSLHKYRVSKHIAILHVREATPPLIWKSQSIERTVTLDWKRKYINILVTSWCGERLYMLVLLLLWHFVRYCCVYWRMWCDILEEKPKDQFERIVKSAFLELYVIIKGKQCLTRV